MNPASIVVLLSSAAGCALVCALVPNGTTREIALAVCATLIGLQFGYELRAAESRKRRRVRNEQSR